MIVCREIFTAAGKILLAAEEESGELTGLWFAGQRYFGATLPEKVVFRENFPLFDTVANSLNAYFSGSRSDFSQIPLAPAGTPFRRLIWHLLRQIPYGEVTTYGSLASQAARLSGKTSLAAQAVGSAVGHNPIAILIPCHRVIGGDGSLTGYAAGIKLKEFLLHLEGCFQNKKTLLPLTKEEIGDSFRNVFPIKRTKKE